MTNVILGNRKTFRRIAIRRYLHALCLELPWCDLGVDGGSVLRGEAGDGGYVRALYTLSAANGNVDRAVYADGSAMVAGSSCAATNGDPCYKTYDHGTLTGITPAQPQTAWDNGSACSFTVAGYGVAGRCNGNYEAFAFSQSNPLAQVLTPGVYAGAVR